MINKNLGCWILVGTISEAMDNSLKNKVEIALIDWAEGRGVELITQRCFDGVVVKR